MTFLRLRGRARPQALLGRGTPRRGSDQWTMFCSRRLRRVAAPPYNQNRALSVFHRRRLRRRAPPHRSLARVRRDRPGRRVAPDGLPTPCRRRRQRRAPVAINVRGRGGVFGGRRVDRRREAARAASARAPARRINRRASRQRAVRTTTTRLSPAANGYSRAAPPRGRRSSPGSPRRVAPGGLRAAEESFVAAQIRAQGEASTRRDRRGTPRRAPRRPPGARQRSVLPDGGAVAEMRAELRAEAERSARRDNDENGGEKEGGEGGATVRFDRFLAMHVNRKPAGVGASFGAASDAAAEAATRRAFAALGDGEGDAIDRASRCRRARRRRARRPAGRGARRPRRRRPRAVRDRGSPRRPKTVDAGAGVREGGQPVGGADEIEASCVDAGVLLRANDPQGLETELREAFLRASEKSRKKATARSGKRDGLFFCHRRTGSVLATFASTRRVCGCTWRRPEKRKRHAFQSSPKRSSSAPSPPVVSESGAARAAAASSSSSSNAGASTLERVVVVVERAAAAPHRLRGDEERDPPPPPPGHP